MTVFARRRRTVSGVVGAEAGAARGLETGRRGVGGRARRAGRGLLGADITLGASAVSRSRRVRTSLSSSAVGVEGGMVSEWS